jgi:tRNA uridine 5-carboxymethylaminomethyl modification enzyme
MLEEQGTTTISQRTKLHAILSRPQIDMQIMRRQLPELDQYLGQYDNEFVEQAEIKMKYEGYIEKEQQLVDKMGKLEGVRIIDSFDFRKITSLSHEAREKLSKVRPTTLGQASRISGVSPSDISVLMVYMGR